MTGINSGHLPSELYIVITIPLEILLNHPLSCCHCQREWLDNQRGQEEQLMSWPQHLFEHFFIVVRVGDDSVRGCPTWCQFISV